MKKDSLVTVAQEVPSLAKEKEELINAVNPENMKEGISSVVTDVSTHMERFIAMLIDAIPAVVKAILFLIIGLFIIRTVLRIVKNRFEKRNVDMSLRGFLMSIIKFVLYALLILSVAGPWFSNNRDFRSIIRFGLGGWFGFAGIIIEFCRRRVDFIIPSV